MDSSKTSAVDIGAYERYVPVEILNLITKEI